MKSIYGACARECLGSGEKNLRHIALHSLSTELSEHRGKNGNENGNYQTEPGVPNMCLVSSQCPAVQPMAPRPDSDFFVFNCSISLVKNVTIPSIFDRSSQPILDIVCNVIETFDPHMYRRSTLVLEHTAVSFMAANLAAFQTVHRRTRLVDRANPLQLDISTIQEVS